MINCVKLIIYRLDVDPLTQFVELLRPKGLLWKEMIGRGDWAWRFPADDGVVFGLVTSGCCHLDLGEKGVHFLRAGDYLLMSAPHSWVLRSGKPVPPVDFETAYATMIRDIDESISETASGTRLVGGHFEFDATNVDLLARCLSPRLLLCSTGNNASRLGAVLSMIDEEVMADRPAKGAMLTRLMEIVLIELLRAPAPEREEPHKGMLAGLSDPKISTALRALHSDIRHNWTVELLASSAGMSRSVFSERFVKLVGEPPITYLLNWRLAIAKDALHFGDRSIEEIAYATGFGSARAFSTAFYRIVGQRPGQYSREAARRTPQPDAKEPHPG